MIRMGGAGGAGWTEAANEDEDEDEGRSDYDGNEVGCGRGIVFLSVKAGEANRLQDRHHSRRAPDSGKRDTTIFDRPRLDDYERAGASQVREPSLYNLLGTTPSSLTWCDVF